MTPAFLGIRIQLRDSHDRKKSWIAGQVKAEGVSGGVERYRSPLNALKKLVLDYFLSISLC